MIDDNWNATVFRTTQNGCQIEAQAREITPELAIRKAAEKAGFRRDFITTYRPNDGAVFVNGKFCGFVRKEIRDDAIRLAM